MNVKRLAGQRVCVLDPLEPGFWSLQSKWWEAGDVRVPERNEIPSCIKAGLGRNAGLDDLNMILCQKRRRRFPVKIQSASTRNLS
jgi:hypothetical protein